MTTRSEDDFVRQGVLIVFLWLVVMFIGGVGLLRFSGVLRGLFG